MVVENDDDLGRTAAKDETAGVAVSKPEPDIVVTEPQPDPPHYPPVLNADVVSTHTPPFVPDNQSWDVAAQIAARRKFNPAVVSTTEAFVPPVPPPPPPVIENQDIRLTGGSTSIRLTGGSTLSVDMQVIRATIPIVPTLYPGEPTGTVLVQNHITINVDSTEFREFSAKVDEVLTELRRSNEFAGAAGQVRDQLLAEITAGMAILQSPKPDPKLIDLFLKRPLLYIADKGAGVVIGAAATAALALLGKATGLW